MNKESENIQERDLKKELESYQERSFIDILFKSPLSLIKRKPIYSFLVTFPIGLIIALASTYVFIVQGDNFWVIDDILLFTTIIIVTPPGMLSYYKKRKNKKIEEEFPDFLRDIAESNGSGMTLTQAVHKARKGSYGKLSPEIKKMSDQISWGISFNEALKRFSGRVKTPLIERSVSLITEAEKAGGDVTDILNAAAKDARKVKMLEKDRKGNMAMYVVIIYVAFFVFLAVILILYNSFIPVMTEATSSTEGLSRTGLMAGSFDPDLYQRIFFHASAIQGFCSGLVAGKMGEGDVKAGLKHSVVLSLIAYVVFLIF
ncbi:MAG: Pilus assembly protein TadC [Candidatus Methanohalarchaeum thermophilum]|uniref:Pilus assembly protein TadC n=1 Tax=Methanohalarchaeum thermophilum TaxID=1903181 RepID=A0A1Q6DUZ0_METT1|nr:MAG: Pilus assembly protein TadC [Candidatus Methanohalarchaeum thermophilum]